jgi:hypothetical protein
LPERGIVCKNDIAMKQLYLIAFLLIAFTVAAQEPQTQSRPSEAESVYHHPVGLEFRYPAGWTVREASSGEAELVPPDQQKNDKGFTEGFLLWGIGGSFTGPADAALSGYLNALVTRMAPFLKQDGDPNAFDGGGSPAMILSWSGASEDGIQVAAKAFVESRGSFAFALVMLGTQERMAFREAVIRGMVASFRFVEQARDPALVGSWKSPPAAAQTQAAVDMGVQMELHPDGTFEFTDSTGAGANGGDQLSGHWYASEGRLCFVYPESFFLNFRYDLAGEPGERKLTLRHASGGFQVLIETPAPKQEP